MNVESAYWMQVVAKLDDGSFIVEQRSPSQEVKEFHTFPNWDALSAHLQVAFGELTDSPSFKEL